MPVHYRNHAHTYVFCVAHTQSRAYDQFIEQFDPRKRCGLDNAAELHIELYAVIFKDGGVAGPDDGAQLQDLFSRYVNAQQMWLRGIREARARRDWVLADDRYGARTGPGSAAL